LVLTFPPLPTDGFQCNVPEAQKIWMRTYKNNSNCVPKVECEVHNPYAERSVLAESQCIMTEGDPDVTFWSYLLIRSVADIFPVAAITALDTAIIIATRETSTGRSEVGKQLAWGSLGWAIFAPIAGAIQLPEEAPAYMVPIVGGCVLMLLAAIVLVFAT
jgi:MFS_1 like family